MGNLCTKEVNFEENYRPALLASDPGGRLETQVDSVPCVLVHPEG